MKRYAILIGVSEYQEYGKMPCAANDVGGMAELLTSTEHGLFTDPVVFDRHSDDEIRKAITRIFKQAKSTDQILLYYSGHGEIDMAGQLHLITANTEKDLLEASSLPTKFIREMIDKSLCEKVMLILDCCFSGAIKDAFKSADVAQSQLNLLAKGEEKSEGKGVYILTASAADETAKQGAEHSVLTKHILTGIREGKADLDQDGFVSMNDLFAYLKERVPRDASQTPTSHHYNVRGNALHVARTFRTYSAEERRACKKKINDLDSDDLLSSEIATHARQVIERNQPQLDKDYFTLLQQLCDGEIGPGTFTRKWLEIKPPTEKQVSSERKTDTIVLPQSFTENLNGVPLEMIRVPAGKFMMGGDKYDNEQPIHEVRVPSFYIGKFQITQKQWQAVMGTTIQQQRNKANKDWPMRGEGADYPMYYVSWHEAQTFCEKLRTMSGKAYRLPNEAEWEYACRAGTTGDYAGDLDEMGWYGNNSGRTVIDAWAIYSEVNRDWTKYTERLTKNGNQTHPVGQKQPNGFGLFDMHGNVWEWCEDVWHENYKDAPQDGSAWADGGNSKFRVVRGGSWDFSDYNCRSANRITTPIPATAATISVFVLW